MKFMCAFKFVVLSLICTIGCHGVPVGEVAIVSSEVTTPLVNRTGSLKILDNARLLFDMLGIRNYACKKYFVCRVGQFFAAKMSLKERLLRFFLEFPLASLIVVDDVLSKPEVAETMATAIGGFTSHTCNEELYELCRSYHGRRSNFTETFTGRFIRQLLVDQDITNKLDHSLMAAAQQELSNGFWNLVNSYMITGHHPATDQNSQTANPHSANQM